MNRVIGAGVLVVALVASMAQRPNSEIAADLRRLAAELEAAVTVAVPAGGDVAAAVRALQATGGVVELQAGATYAGPVWLPRRPVGAPLITVRTAGTLPVRRVGPADAPSLATIAATDAYGALQVVDTAGYRVEGVRLTMASGGGEVVVVQNSDDVTLDRVLFCPGAGACAYASAENVKRVVRLNGRRLTVSRSYLNAGPRAGQDNQAVAGWEGAGPYTVTDNALLASGENLLFGGSDNAGGAATNPADILVEANLLLKPQEWRAFPGTVKNLLELKNATRVTVRGNVLDGCWADAQPGWAVVLTPVNQDGGAPWTVVRDVLIERNHLRNAQHGINVTGRGYTNPTQQTVGVVVRDNVFEVQKWLQAASEVADLAVEGNVIDNGHSVAGLYVGGVREPDGTSRTAATAAVSLQWFGNWWRDNGYGIHSEVGINAAALAARTQAWAWGNNRVVGLRYAYPVGTTAADEATFAAAKAAKLAGVTR